MNRWTEYGSGIVKILGSLAGVDISRYRPAAPRRQRLLQTNDVRVAFDVGAHVGEYALELRSGGFAGRIISFEPARAHFRVLTSRAASDLRWTTEHLALSDIDGRHQLGVAGRYTSLLTARSSLLDMFPGSQATEQEDVDVCRFDGLTGYTDLLCEPALLKLDVQGNELRALQGVGSFLERFSLVEVELSIVEFYDEQASFYEVMHYLDEHSFTLVDLDPITRDNQTGQLAQANGIFARQALRADG